MIDEMEFDSERDAEEREQVFKEKIKPLIDRLYDLCTEHGVSLLCTSVYSRGEVDMEDYVQIDFDGYTVATGKLEMMPEQMIALAGILNPDILKYISEKMSTVMKDLQDRSKAGEILRDTELTDEEQEYLRMGETFSRYADALKLAGPYGFRRTKDGYEMLEVLVSPEDIEYEDDEEDEEEKSTDDESKMDDTLENDLRNLLKGF